jgi:hypothetical protein
MARFEKHRRGVMSQQLETIVNHVILDVRQLVIIPEYITTPYFPPSQGLRFWRSQEKNYHKGNFREAVRARKESLDSKVDVMISLLSRMGMRGKRLDGLELTRLLHVIWMEEDAYREWIGSVEEMKDEGLV